MYLCKVIAAQDNYLIKLPIFEGPFDLLLFFIERDELNVHDIPIAKITDDFLGYLQQMQQLNIELASEFIYVAATLMRIKAKMLLPRPEVDEQGNEIDPRQDLVSRLLEYKRFKEAAQDLDYLGEQRGLLHERGGIPKDLKEIAKNISAGEELLNFDLYKLLQVYQKVLLRLYDREAEQPRHDVELYPYTIEEQKLQISKLLQLNQRINYQTVLAQSKDKVQLVYNLLAILEMLQQQMVQIQIGLGFNNFWVENREVVEEE